MWTVRDGVELLFQQVPGAKGSKNGLHVDLRSSNRMAELDASLQLAPRD